MKENILLQPGEEILPIQGYEGLYSITSHGRVWSYGRELRYNNGCRIIKSGFLKSRLSKRGYLNIRLSKGGERKSYLISQLTAQAFIPNLQNLPEVNHKDGDKQNNFAGTKENNYIDGNLEWCTSEENNNHAMINGLKYKIYSKYYGVSFDKGIYRKSKPWKAQIMIRRKNCFLGYYKSEIEAAQAYNDYVIKHDLNRPLNKI